MTHHKKISFLVATLCLVCTSACRQPSPLDVSATHPFLPFESEVFAELNNVRLDPRQYAARLEEIKKRYDQKLARARAEEPPQPDQPMQAFSEAIQWLKSTRALPALKISRGMSLAASDHLREQGEQEPISQSDRDGGNLAERANRYGAWSLSLGEIVVYGNETAQRLVIQLLVDYDNPGRQRRLSMLNPDFSVIGIACKEHALYRNMCVITFAGQYVEKRDF